MAIYNNHKPEFDFKFRFCSDQSSERNIGRGRNANVRKLIQAGNYIAACELLKGAVDEQSKNTSAVLFMRLHKPQAAIDLLRSRVWDLSTCLLRADVPLFAQLNLATAFFIKGNVSGCVAILRQLEVAENEQMEELVANIRRWEISLSLFQKLDWKLCGIEHVRKDIEFQGMPGRFGWEPEFNSTAGNELGTAESPGTLGWAG